MMTGECGTHLHSPKAGIGDRTPADDQQPAERPAEFDRQVLVCLPLMRRQANPIEAR